MHSLELLEDLCGFWRCLKAGDREQEASAAPVPLQQQKGGIPEGSRPHRRNSTRMFIDRFHGLISQESELNQELTVDILVHIQFYSYSKFYTEN